MKILLVHDRISIANLISEDIQKNFPTTSILLIAQDGIGARNALREDLFDLAIFDLTLPNLHGRSSTEYSVVSDIFEELFFGTGLNIPGDIVGITHDAAALAKIDASLGPHLMAIVEEDKDGNWRSRLMDRIKYVHKSAESRRRSLSQHFDFDVAIITALDKEFLPFERIFELNDVDRFSSAREFVFRDRNDISRRGVAISVGRAGQASAASTTQAVLTQFRPALCLMSGFCGGFSAKTKIGDVILADSMVDWDYGKWKGKGEAAVFAPRPEPIVIRNSQAYLAARELLQSPLKAQSEIQRHIRELSGGKITEISIKLGPVASGSAVVAHSGIIQRISTLNDNILGVDMEGYGFYYASAYTNVKKPNFLFIKSVADFCDKAKSDKYHESCIYLSAKTVEEIIRFRWPFETDDGTRNIIQSAI